MKRIHFPSVAAGTFKCYTSIGSCTSRETHCFKKAWRGKGKIIRAHEALCYRDNKFGMCSLILLKYRNRSTSMMTVHLYFTIFNFEYLPLN
jgi:hypothetical protein